MKKEPQLGGQEGLSGGSQDPYPWVGDPQTGE